MKNIIVYFIIIGFLFLLPYNSISVLGINKTQEAQEIQNYGIPYANIYVNCNNTLGPYDGSYQHPFRYIQDAIDASIDGNIVYVFKGIYKENLIINKKIKLFGETEQSTIIDGGFKNNTIYVKVSDVTIKKFSIT